MERCVHKYLYNYIIENAILHFNQDLLGNQLLQIYHTFCNAVDSGQEVGAVFCDISKAFNRVWHRGLLHKLSGIWCSDKITSWFSSYLTAKTACCPFWSCFKMDVCSSRRPSGFDSRPITFPYLYK